jgi:signal transduction histidine kinase
MILDRLNEREQGEPIITTIDRLHPQILEFNDLAAQVRADLDSEVDANYASLQTTQLGVLAGIEQGINITAILTVTAVVVVFATGGLAAYSISRRVTALKVVANDIAGGKLDEQIKTTGSDEISSLATAFERMRENLVQAQQELESKNIKLQELDKLKDEFIGVASHELRSPIHPILGYASMARQGKIPMKMAMDVIYKQAERLKQLANDILDVSKIESGSMSYNMQKVGIHEVLLNCLVASSSTVDSKAVQINARIDKDNKDIEIVADKDKLTQVFSNIIGNAVKFTKKGSINVETYLDRESDKFEITVSDTGGGIPAEILPRLFTKFASKSLADTSSHGTGLGLFISRAIVNAHGGEIFGYNNNIGGATFKIELPVSGNKIELPVGGKR